eukprot:746152-Hanusia_phi.AAC.4
MAIVDKIIKGTEHKQLLYHHGKELGRRTSAVTREHDKEACIDQSTGDTWQSMPAKFRRSY